MFARKWFKMHALLLSLSALAVLLAVSVNFFRFEKASYALPRLIIQLERSIGYGGFIHNFKNLVLRPGEEIYFEAAISDYLILTGILAEIEQLTSEVGIKADIAPVKETLAEYREIVGQVYSAHEQGIPIGEIDRMVRISDDAARAELGEFEQDLLQVMQRRRSSFYLISLVLLSSVFAGVVLLAYLQARRRHQAEQDHETLKEHETYLLQAERIAQLGRWKSDAGGLMTWSAATGAICGVDEPGGMETFAAFMNRVIQADQPKLRVAMEKAMQSGGEFSCVHRMQRSEDTVISVVNSGEVVKDASGSFKGFVGTLQDISELVDMESELRQSQKMEAIGNLAGGMAHDFNNILAVILGNLELLRSEQNPGKHLHYINNAIDATRRGADLTRNMLGFARRSHLNPRQIKANDLVRDVVNWAARLLPATIKIETSLLENLWSFTADETIAKSALLNLMLNARDAMAEGGKLTIETANVRLDDDYVQQRAEDLVPGRYVMLAISDTGTGMDEATLEKVFDPFFSTKPTGQGTGLGLSMVLGFMKQSGGTVRVYSEPGVGTTFKLFFKAENQDIFETDQTPQNPQKDFGNLQGKRLLLVEDNLDLLEALQSMLSESGMEVTAAKSGDEALAIWSETQHFDVVATDIVMPGKLQGTHLAKAIRASSGSVPFIFMSGYANEAMVHGNGLRPEDVRLMKPVGKTALLSAISDALRSAERKLETAAR